MTSTFNGQFEYRLNQESIMCLISAYNDKSHRPMIAITAMEKKTAMENSWIVKLWENSQEKLKHEMNEMGWSVNYMIKMTQDCLIISKMK